MRLPDLLVTGTDTGIGKTVIAAALVLSRRTARIDALGFKPVESGVGDGEMADSVVLAAASGVSDPLAEPIARLAEPLAPAVAAERAGMTLDPAAIEARIEALRREGRSLVVEGAGGLLVPLAWGYTARDLAARMGLHAVVVGRAGLGTLNHVQLTAEALARHGVPVRAVVLNGRAPAPNLAEATNPGALRRLLPDVRVLEVPMQDHRETLEAARAIAPLLEGL